MSEPRTFLGGRVVLHAGDCREVLRGMADNSVDSVVTDPPYHLQSIVKRFGSKNSAPAKHGTDGAFKRASAGFMSKSWDGGDIAFQTELWAEVLRVLKPGGYILAFSGCRTYHHMACAIEDAGFITHPMFAWCFGSGFPKAHNVSKQIDKRGGKQVSWFGPWLRKWREEKGVTQKQIAKLFPSKTGGLTGCVANWELGFNLPTNEQFNLICKTFELPFEYTMAEAKREKIGERISGDPVAWYGQEERGNGIVDITLPGSDAAREWDGWFYGTQSLKPALEPVYFGQKPFERGLNGAQNVMKWGVGAINVGACKVGYGAKGPDRPLNQKVTTDAAHWGNSNADDLQKYKQDGRWPANLIHDGSDEVLECFPETVPFSKQVIDHPPGNNSLSKGCDSPYVSQRNADNGGSAARFFASFPQEDDNISLCDLCALPFEAETVSIFECNANNAEPNSQTENILIGASVRRDAAGLHVPVNEVSGHPSNGYASNAERRSSQIHLPKCYSVPENALILRRSKIAQNVKYAASLCDSCAIAIAHALVALKTRQSVESIQLPASICARNGRILRHHLALYVAGRESTDTILTTESLKTLFGSVFHAIASTIGQSEEQGPRASIEKSKRIFYTAKADNLDRLGSRHPTVKPLDLIQYFVRMVTPRDGTCLDFFAGTATTAEACFREGFRCVLIEREAEYIKDIERRMALVMEGPVTRANASIKASGRARDDGPLFNEAAE